MSVNVAIPVATPAPKTETDGPRLAPSLDHDRDQDQEDQGRALLPEEVVEDHEVVQGPVPTVQDVIEGLEVDPIGVLTTRMRRTGLGSI